MKSLWSKTVSLKDRKPLEADLRTKNVVIGAGMAGILIAYLLQEKGEEVIVLEANEIASGQTKNTTAKITSQHGLIYHDMIKNIGLEKAKGYAQASIATMSCTPTISSSVGTMKIFTLESGAEMQLSAFLVTASRFFCWSKIMP